MHYIYCPQCGKKLIAKAAGDDGDVPFCNSCGTYWFDTFPCCTITLVANECNEIALLRQDYMSSKHANFVSGYITPNETAEENALREVKEELGITAERLEYAGTYWYDKKGLLMHGFIAFAKKCDFTLSDEVDFAEWVDAKAALEKMFPDKPGNTMFPIYKKYLEITGLSE